MDKANNIRWDQYWILNINPRKSVLKTELTKLLDIQVRQATNISLNNNSLIKRQNKINILKKALEKFNN